MTRQVLSKKKEEMARNSEFPKDPLPRPIIFNYTKLEKPTVELAQRKYSIRYLTVLLSPLSDKWLTNLLRHKRILVVLKFDLNCDTSYINDHEC